VHQEHNRFYADWYDKRGKRKRKSFQTAEEATRYELEQKAKARPGKNQGTVQRSPKCAVPTGQQKTQITTQTKRQQGNLAASQDGSESTKLVQ
jgi:hypothetical protein